MIFCTDLDNTLIYSYRRQMPEEKRCVEIYEGREVSFLSEKTYHGLLKLQESMMIVPVTTRTVEQYQRIQLGIRPFAYALVCNGGVLLCDGKENKNWYQESMKLVEEAQEELQKAMELLASDERITFEIRNIRELFIFTKSRNAKDTISDLKENLDLTKVDVFSNGVKVYVVPKQLNKGMAVKRLRRLMKEKNIIAAGDSLFDVSMLQEAEIGLAPEELQQGKEENPKIHYLVKDSLFSEQVLEFIEEQIR